MLDFIFKLQDIYLFALLTFITIIFSVFAVFAVKRYVPLEMRYRDNPVLGNVCSLIGIIYGILAGITALYLINNNNYTSDAVLREANAVADLYRSTIWLKEPARDRIQTTIKKYVNDVINVEWPLMQQGKQINFNGAHIINSIEKELSSYPMKGQGDSIIMLHMLTGLKVLYDAREQRIHMSTSELSPEIWFVILMGTFLIIAMNYIFGMNFYLHIIAVSAAALMASSMIFLLVTLDKPFQGQFAIAPDAFIATLDLVGESKAKNNNHLSAHPAG